MTAGGTPHLELNPRLKTWSIAAAILAVLGIIVSAYATYHHLELKRLGQTDAFCNINQTVSCDVVAGSEYSEILSIPMGLWGAGYFLGALLLVGLAIVRPQDRRDFMQGYAALVLIGFIVTVILGGISYFQIGAFCLTCTFVYALCLLQIAALLMYRDQIPVGGDTGGILRSGGLAALAVILVTGGFKLAYSPSEIERSAPPKAAEPAKITAPTAEIKVDFSAYSGLGEDYRKGSDSAKVRIVEFADFECPACRNAAMNLMKKLHEDFGDQILIVFKNFPLDKSCNKSMQSSLHQFACRAAVLARCAGREGKFWQFHDIAFDRQKGINADTLVVWAREIGISQANIDACLKDQDIMLKIQEDIAIGEQIGVQGTPAIYINGREARLRGYDDLARQVEALLR